LLKKVKNGFVYFEPENLLPFPEVSCGIFTRRGGVSTDCYKSLNLGIHVNDNSHNVIQNRYKVLEELGFTPEKLVAMEQIHSDNLEIVTDRDAGRGLLFWDDALPETDAMITACKGIVLMAVVADCSVAVFYDPLNEVIAIAHCGWRGTVKKLPLKVINNLENNFKSDSSRLIACVFPGIGPDCFEVGPEVAERFIENFGFAGEDFFLRKGEKIFLDLQKAIIYQLLSGGVKEENIDVLNLCTSCNTELFYSHRKEAGKTGRNGVFIGMKND